MLEGEVLGRTASPQPVGALAFQEHQNGMAQRLKRKQNRLDQRKKWEEDKEFSAFSQQQGYKTELFVNKRKKNYFFWHF